MTNIERIDNTHIIGKNAVSEEEELQIQTKLWQFLGRQTTLYTVGDSSSIPIETAQELLQSIVFTLGLALKSKGFKYKHLVLLDIEETLKIGEEVIKTKIAHGKKTLEFISQNAPKVDNIAFWDSYKGIVSFFKRYNFIFFAHQIPCDIDYPLCLPVSEELLGIEYINEYLRRLMLENKILDMFDSAAVSILLKKLYIDYIDLSVNLCEPVIINSAGLAIMDKDPLGLSVPAALCEEMQKYLYLMTESELRSALTLASKKLCAVLYISSDFEKEYITQTVINIAPRLREAIYTGNISRIFFDIGV